MSNHPADQQLVTFPVERPLLREFDDLAKANERSRSGALRILMKQAVEEAKEVSRSA